MGLCAQMPPIDMPRFDFTKYKVRLQRTDLQAEGYRKTAAMRCCGTLRRQPELTPGPALVAQGLLDDARYGFVGRGADAMRSGSAAAAVEAPFLLMRDLADLPLNLPPKIQMGAPCAAALIASFRVSASLQAACGGPSAHSCSRCAHVD
jgi:hypothetical protein